MSEVNKYVEYNVTIPKGVHQRAGTQAKPTDPTSWSVDAYFPNWYTDSFTGSTNCGGYNSSFDEKQRANRGVLVTGGMKVYLTKVTHTKGSISRAVRRILPPHDTYHYHDGAGQWGSVNLTPPIFSSLQSHVTTVGSFAAEMLLRKYTDNRKVLGGAIAAEAAKTAELAVSYATGVRGLFEASYLRLLRKLKLEHSNVVKARRLRPAQRARRNRNIRQRIVDFATQEWIKLNFGMLPFISDLEGLAESSFVQGQSRRPLKLRAVVTKPPITLVAESLASPEGRTGVRYRNVRTVKDTVRVKLLTLIRVTNGDAALESLGFTKRDIAATLWELLPWSWLVDYVSNAGKVIDAVSQFALVPASTQRTTVVLREDKTVPSAAFTVPNGYRVLYSSFTPGTRLVTTTDIVRKAEAGVPLPTLQLRNNLSHFKLSMVATVAWQKLSGNRLNNLVKRLISAG